MRIKEKGQSIAEYFLILSVLLAAVLACGFVGRMRGAFTIYFAHAATTMTEIVNP